MTAPARPRYADDRVQLCDLAQHLLSERVTKYPAVVAAGRMPQAEADAKIMAMRAVATRWRMLTLAELIAWQPGTALDLASEVEMRDTLAAASAHAAGRATRDPDNTDKADYAAAIGALLWHAENAVRAEAA